MEPIYIVALLLLSVAILTKIIYSIITGGIWFWVALVAAVYALGNWINPELTNRIFAFVGLGVLLIWAAMAIVMGASSGGGGSSAAPPARRGLSFSPPAGGGVGGRRASQDSDSDGGESAEGVVEAAVDKASDLL